MKTVAYQFVKESDGQIWQQAMCWASDEGFTGRWNPDKVDSVPKGAARLSLAGLEWEPCTEGEIVVAAWIAGVSE
jgi:hypothetical protein